MAKYLVRQRSLYYEDFSVEADSPEQAIDMVNSGGAEGDGTEYLETINTYLLESDGVYQAQDQPSNASPLPSN